MMMKTKWVAVAAMGVLASQTGCFTTKIVADRAIDSRARPSTDRQWFTLGGLVPLSGPAGRECENGLSYAESQLAGVDILINIGLAVGGAIAGSAACADADDEERASCMTLGASLVPFLVGSRTVEYACTDTSAANASQGWLPAQPASVRVPMAPEEPAPQPSPAPSEPPATTAP